MAGMHYAVCSPLLYVFTSLNTSLSLTVLADKTSAQQMVFSKHLEGSQTSYETYRTFSLVQLVHVTESIRIVVCRL